MHLDDAHKCKQNLKQNLVDVDTYIQLHSPIKSSTSQLVSSDQDTLTVSHLSDALVMPTSQSKELSDYSEVSRKLVNDSLSSDEDDSDDSFQISYVPKEWNELPFELQCILPKEYSYLIEEYTKLPNSTCHTPKFHIQFRMNLQKEGSVSQWLKDFQCHSKCTYRVTRTYKLQMKRVKYKVDMHCQHFKKKLTSKQLAQSSSSKRKSVSLVSDIRNKKTKCASKLLITVQIPPKSLLMKRPQASNLQEYHTLVKLTFDHNHSTESAQALGFRPVLDKTKEKYISLFKMGHSASSARFYYETLLLTNQSGDTQRKIADRALNPTKQDVYRLFNTWRQNELGDDNGESLFKQLEHEIQLYNEKWKDHGGCAKLQPFKSSSLDDDDAAGGNTTDDSDKENDCDSDTPKPKPKRRKRE